MNTLLIDRHSRFFKIALFGILLCVSVRSIAQETALENQASPKDSHTITEIIVTAAKRELRLNQFPGSLSILNQQLLEDQAPINIIDIAAMVPGLSSLDTGARNSNPVIMRGIHFDGISSNDFGGDGGTVATYVDGIPMQGYYVPPQFFLKDLSGIEVLRGPQGTLYGASSLSGLVLYKTQQPDLNNFSMHIHSQLSTTDESDHASSDSDLVINVPIIDKTLAMRALVSHQDTSGFIDNNELVSGPEKDINDEQLTAFRISVKYQPSQNFRINAMHQKQKSDVGDRQADNIYFTHKSFVASSHLLQPTEGTLHLNALTTDYDFNDITLTVSANNYDYKQKQIGDLTDLYINWYGYDPINQTTEHSAVDVKQNSIEARLASHFDNTINGVLGVFYSVNNLNVRFDDFLVQYPALDRTLDYSATQNQKLLDRALFGEISWSPSEDLNITTGARYFNYSDTAEACNAYPNNPFTCYKQSINDDNLSIKLAALLQLKNSTKFYANISEGFRRGGANPGIPDELANRRQYSPDSTVNIELGLSRQLLKQRLNIDASLFYIDWNEVQLITTETVPSTDEFISYISNANDANSQGIELEMQWQINELLRLHSSYSYSDASLSEDALSYNDVDGNGDNGYKNNRLPSSPKQQFFSTLSFAQSLKLFTLNASISAQYVGNITTQLNDEHIGYNTLGGYTLLNTRIGLAQNHWRASLFVKNLGNKRAVTGIQGDFYYGSQGAFEYVNRPRTIGVDLLYRW